MKLLAAIGALAILLGCAAGAYFFGGFYSVSAMMEDPAPVSWALQRVRHASISHHDAAKPPIAVDDAAVIQAGAKGFAKFGCANCHGGPGVGWAKFSEGLNPGPPDLKDVAKAESVSHIFWVVKNGIRMTGMPSFGKAGIDDTQLWQIAAFVKKLPGVSDADYKAWTANPMQ
ncbi:MAG: c-type cytochrome [Hyphomicrobiaceae bacterium]